MTSLDDMTSVQLHEWRNRNSAPVIAKLRAALLIAQKWMPVNPIDDEARQEVALVRQVLEETK